MKPQERQRDWQQARKRRKRARGFRRFRAFLFLLAVLLGLRAFWLSRENRESAAETGVHTVGQKTDLPVSAVDKDSWKLLLVNRENLLPEDYEVELTTLDNGEQVDARIYPELQSMFDAARKEGIYPVVGSAYRTAAKQQSLMDEKIQAYQAEGYSAGEAKELAEAWVAIPGTSEHQMGIAVDINADKTRSSNDEVYDWLARNAHLYGFILRYPSDKSEITGTIFEPWHYRYVGTQAAGDIHRLGLCLEEYLETLS